HLTDWIGDDGFVVRHQSQIRRHNPVGDIVSIEGRVKAISHDEDRRPCVEIEQRAVNQDGELSALGTGLVRLPSRGD
ncbi:MAG TPA: acyl dehydratase, partial [Mycobacterium sp.]|nr:acyl dehydratase [Mycobacterium sp.]